MEHRLPFIYYEPMANEKLLLFHLLLKPLRNWAENAIWIKETAMVRLTEENSPFPICNDPISMAVIGGTTADENLARTLASINRDLPGTA